MSVYLGDKLVSLTAHIDYNTNDATATTEDVMQGEVFYNTEGRQVGTLTVDKLLPELSNPAGAEQILSGYQGIGADGGIIDGSMIEKGISFRNFQEAPTSGQEYKYDLTGCKKAYVICIMRTSSSPYYYYGEIEVDIETGTITTLNTNRNGGVIGSYAYHISFDTSSKILTVMQDWGNSTYGVYAG
jgi:hypothetical protein